MIAHKLKIAYVWKMVLSCSAGVAIGKGRGASLIGLCASTVLYLHAPERVVT